MYQSLTADFLWKESDLVASLPVLLSLVSFITYWFVAQSGKIKERFYRNNSFDNASVKHIFFTKYFGFLSMGVVPAIACLLVLPDFSLADIGLTVIPETTVFSLVWIGILSALLIPITFFSAKKEKNLVNYPQIRAKTWTRKTVFIAALGWALYLFGYELLFRGTLFFPLVESIGVWPAIAVNIGMYSATHIPKGLDETIGAIPLGLVLCILTLLSGTIWIAFIVHVVMAWTNCFTALRFHPEIHYKSSKA